MKLSYQTYIFDLDGTLIDSSKDITEGVNHTLSKFNLPEKSDEEIMKHVGKGLKYLLKMVFPENTDENTIEKAYLIQKKFYETKEIKAIPYQGTQKVIQILKKYQKNIFLVTNKPQKATLKVLEKLNLTNYFNGIFGADALIEHKPSPYPINHIAKTYSLNKKQMVFIGDSKTDFETSKNAKTDFIWVTYGYESENLNTSKKADKITDILNF